MFHKLNLYKFKKDFFGVAFLSFMVNVFILAPTIYMLQIFDRILISRSDSSLLIITVFIVLIIANMAFAEHVRTKLLISIGKKINERFSFILFHSHFKKMAENDNSRFDSFGEFTRIRQFITGPLVLAVLDMPWTLIYICILFFLHPLLGEMSLIFLGFHFFSGLASDLTQNKNITEINRIETQESVLSGNFMKNLGTIKALGMLPNITNRWQMEHKKTLKKDTSIKHVMLHIRAYLSFVQYAQQAIILTFAAWLVMKGELSIGAMIAANVFMANALRPVSIIISKLSEFKSAKQAFLNLKELFVLTSIEMALNTAERPTGDIRVVNYTAYQKYHGPIILKKLNSVFSQGELVLIVGPSGAGKSTFLKSLLGIWPFGSGEILLGGNEIKTISREMLGNQVGYLPQEIDILPGTIGENICRFNQIKTEEIIQAAELAKINEMISEFPFGYNTRIGPGFQEISGGQSQRIGLARAFYGMPEYLFLDEPNSKLDDAGEQALISALVHLKTNKKTIFIVSHSPIFFELADKILYLLDGQIEKYGPLGEFISDPKYYDIFKISS